MNGTRNSKESGVALIFAMGVLTLLLVLGVTFVLNMTVQNRMANDWEGQCVAEQAALGGIERAIAELKKEMCPYAYAAVSQKWYYGGVNSPSYRVSGQSYSGTLGTAPIRSRYALKIWDVTSRININDSNANLQVLLEGLPYLGDLVDGQTRSYWILDLRSRLPGQKFCSKSQLLQAKGVTQSVYNAVTDYLCTQSWQDPGTQGPTGLVVPRCPININTACREVLSAVVRPVLTARAEAASVADKILTTQSITGGQFDSWQKYNTFVDGLSLPGLTQNEIENLKDNANPNRRNTWDRSDMINPVRSKPSTEFCFHSGGMYEVESRGEALDRRGGGVQAAATMTALLKINKIFSVTRKQDFAQSPEWYRVTWLDSCPVDSADDSNSGGFAANYKKINDSLKAGYWDNFDEDAAYTQQMIQKVGGGSGATYVLEDVDGDGDNELHHKNTTPADKASDYGDFEITYKPLGQAVDSWEFCSFYMKATNRDDSARWADPLTGGAADVGRIRFRQSGGAYSQMYARNNGLLYVKNDPALPGITGPWTQAMVFEVSPAGSDLWVGGTTPNDERFSGGLLLKEVDGTNFAQPFHNTVLPDAVPSGGLGGCGLHVPEHIKYYLKIPQGAVIADVSSGGPDGRNPPSFLFSYTYKYEKWYRLFMFHRSESVDFDTEGVSMKIIDSSGMTSFPGTSYGGEINTWMNKRGLTGFKNSANMAAWDDVRIISRWGDYKGVVLDGGPGNIKWGAISWTVTIPDSASSVTEWVTMDAKMSSTPAMTDVVMWTFGMPDNWVNWVFWGQEPFCPQGLFVSSEGERLGREPNYALRYLQFRAYVGSRRLDTDPMYCRETPVLEDVTITCFPPVRASSMRRVSS